MALDFAKIWFLFNIWRTNGQPKIYTNKIYVVIVSCHYSQICLIDVRITLPLNILRNSGLLLHAKHCSGAIVRFSDKSSFVCFYALCSSQQFLAHLSRRLMGELIVYQSLPRPSVRQHFQTSSPLKPLCQSNSNVIKLLQLL